MSNIDANNPRKSEYDINPIFLNRWSPRSFTGESVEDAALFSLFEAARWAPSGNNSQPWRFIYAKHSSSSWDAILELVNENNRRWASRAAVLVALLSKKTHIRNGDTEHTPLRNHSLDAGAAWANLALQAVHIGLATHAIGGFDRESAPSVLGVPDGFQVEILIAIGKQGEKASLPEDIQAREQPTLRKPLADFYAEGQFNFKD